MTVAAPDRRRLYIQAGAGLACVAVVVVGLWMVAGLAGSHRSATSGDATVRATVTASASCQGSDTHDSVSFQLDGAVHRAQLDGCGQQQGQVISVLVPAGFNGDTVLEPTDAAPGDSSGLSHRVAFVLLIVATVVGGAFAYRFRAAGRETGRAAGRAGGRATPSKPPAQPKPDQPVGPGQPAQPDEDYHSDIRPVPRELDPDATGVDWFEDSSAGLPAVAPPADLARRVDRS